MMQLLAFFVNAWVIVGLLFLLGIIAGIAALFVYVILALYHIVRKYFRDIYEEHRPHKPCDTPECRAFRKAFVGPVLEAFKIPAGVGPLIPPAVREGYLTTKRPVQWVVSWKGSGRYSKPSGGQCTRQDPCWDGVHKVSEVMRYDPNDGGVHSE